VRAISKKLRKVLVGLGQRIDFLSHARPPLPTASTSRLDACFIVRDHNGRARAYAYFEDEPGRV
jgi:hypothetical protein